MSADRTRAPRGAWPGISIAALTLALTVHAADAQVEVGDRAPTIRFTDLKGTAVDTAEWCGSPQVLVFGDADQERTKFAVRVIDTILGQPELVDERVRWACILSKGSPIDRMGVASGRSFIVGQDTDRSAFEAYHVIARPTVVIVDSDCRIVHVKAGWSSRFGDVVQGALLKAVGKISDERFERVLNPPDGPISEDKDQHRVERLVRLAEQLCEHDMFEQAEHAYREALSMEGVDLTAASIGLGNLLVEQGRYDAADLQFRAALVGAPENDDAAIGLAIVHASSEAGDVSQGIEMMKGVLARRPTQANAHYALARLLERQGDIAGACQHYRTAAEILRSSR